MKSIESRFNVSFAPWKIRLPPDAVKHRRRGKIVKNGWAIWYLFSSDEKGEYLDVYESHPHTDDDHYRLYADGSSQLLPSISGTYMAPSDPEEAARAEAEFYAENQKIGAMLEEKGFGIAGDEPGLVQVNRGLLVKKREG